MSISERHEDNFLAIYPRLRLIMDLLVLALWPQNEGIVVVSLLHQ